MGRVGVAAKSRVLVDVVRRRLPGEVSEKRAAARPREDQANERGKQGPMTIQAFLRLRCSAAALPSDTRWRLGQGSP